MANFAFALSLDRLFSRAAIMTNGGDLKARANVQYDASTVAFHRVGDLYIQLYDGAQQSVNPNPIQIPQSSGKSSAQPEAAVLAGVKGPRVGPGSALGQQ